MNIEDDNEEGIDFRFTFWMYTLFIGISGVILSALVYLICKMI